MLGLGLACDGGAPPVAFDIHLEDGGMVDEAVDGGDGHCRIGEHLAPVSERLVCCDQQRAALVAGGDEFEQHAGLGLILGDVGEIIEDQQVEPVQLGDGCGQLQRLSLDLEALDEVGGAHEQCTVAASISARPRAAAA